MSHTADGVCFVARTHIRNTTMRPDRRPAGAAASLACTRKDFVILAGITDEIVVLIALEVLEMLVIVARVHSYSRVLQRHAAL